MTARPRRLAPSKESTALVNEMNVFFARYKEWTRERLPEGETNPARLLVLVSLSRWGSMTMGTLAARLARPKSNLTLLVDELEAEELVARQAHPSDRRATLVELTAAGRRVATEHAGAYDREIAVLFERLPDADRKQLLATVRRLVEILREEAKA
jgi:DNA-binding MarR family transcriptional regulator